MSYLELFLCGFIWLLMACFSAAQTAWVFAEGDIKEKMSVRFLHWFCLVLLVVILFKLAESTGILVLLYVLLFATAELLPVFFARRKPEIVYKRLKPFVRYISKIFFPVTNLLDKLDTALDQKAEQNEKTFSIEDLSSALDVVSQQNKETQESKILKGIVRFAEIEASSIMTPRVNMVCVSYTTTFNDLMKIIRESGYSRMPVFNGNLDRISGVLYIKDILPHLKEADSFEWQKLIRPVLFVPETKKIDLLLRELQDRRVHLAVVVDEYGGTSGLVTLEDLLEEVVGEISDEFDGSGDAPMYRKIEENIYTFDASMSVHDFCRLMYIKDDFFEKYEGEYETLAGFVLEILGRFPVKGEEVSAPPFFFKVETLGNRRIKRIRLTIKNTDK